MIALTVSRWAKIPVGLELAIKNLINELYSKDISRKIKSFCGYQEDEWRVCLWDSSLWL